ncbi:mitochondrial chaperone [Ascosphaera pollenicola]|nr:mitochondrial chaperone [Ascosphaera pollenicola]
MAQALCGPSNPLQNLQKHSTTDRSLQQDRLVSSQPSSQVNWSHLVLRQAPNAPWIDPLADIVLHHLQNFRSHGPSEALAADAELAAFEAGIAGPAAAVAGPAAFAHPQLPHHHRHHHPAFTPQPLAHPYPAEAAWASDFQQLNISGGSQAPLHHARAHSFPFRPASGGWQDEFLQQQQQHHQAQAQAHAPSHASQRLFGTVGAMSPTNHLSQYPMYGSAAATPSTLHHATSTQTTTTTTETLDDAAFEAAFAEARAEIDQLEQQTTHHVQETVTADTEAHQQQEIRIGADTIQDTGKSGAHETDDLARTAGQLLDSVQHETSQKFKESNFLALMRQLRDREVVVDGDEFRQVKQPLHPGGEFYPEGRRRSVAEAAIDEKTVPPQQPFDSELPPLPYGYGYETSYGNNYLESKSIGDSNVLYDGMAWEKGVLPDYLRVV